MKQRKPIKIPIKIFVLYTVTFRFYLTDVFKVNVNLAAQIASRVYSAVCPDILHIQSTVSSKTGVLTWEFLLVHCSLRLR